MPIHSLTLLILILSALCVSSTAHASLDGNFGHVKGQELDQYSWFSSLYYPEGSEAREYRMSKTRSGRDIALVFRQHAIFSLACERGLTSFFLVGIPANSPWRVTVPPKVFVRERLLPHWCGHHTGLPFPAPYKTIQLVPYSTSGQYEGHSLQLASTTNAVPVASIKASDAWYKLYSELHSDSDQLILGGLLFNSNDIYIPSHRVDLPSFIWIASVKRGKWTLNILNAETGNIKSSEHHCLSKLIIHLERNWDVRIEEILELLKKDEARLELALNGCS